MVQQVRSNDFSRKCVSSDSFSNSNNSNFSNSKKQRLTDLRAFLLAGARFGQFLTQSNRACQPGARIPKKAFASVRRNSAMIEHPRKSSVYGHRHQEDARYPKQLAWLLMAMMVLAKGGLLLHIQYNIPFRHLDKFSAGNAEEATRKGNICRGKHFECTSASCTSRDAFQAPKEYRSLLTSDCTCTGPLPFLHRLAVTADWTSSLHRHTRRE